MSKRILLKFNHGLGDATQATIILKHLTYHHPDWLVDFKSGWGKHSLYYGLCNETLLEQPKERIYNQIHDLTWWEPTDGDTQKNVPLTKVTLCLRSQLHLQPIPSLYYYQINIQPYAEQAATEYIKTLPQQQKIIGIHYQGNTSTGEKDLETKTIRKLCNWLNDSGYIVIIFDWNKRSPLPNKKTIFCPSLENPIWQKKQKGDGNIIAALIDKLDLLIGIDSSVGHIAASTKTPSIIVWRGHHPINFFDLSNNCIHLVPDNSRGRIRASNKREAELYFQENYKYVYYDKLYHALQETVCGFIQAITKSGKWWMADFRKRERWWKVGKNHIKKINIKIRSI